MDAHLATDRLAPARPTTGDALPHRGEGAAGEDVEIPTDTQLSGTRRPAEASPARDGQRRTGRGGRGNGAGKTHRVTAEPDTSSLDLVVRSAEGESPFHVQYGPHQNPVSALMDDVDGTSDEG